MRYYFLICMAFLAQTCLAKITIQDAYARASRGPSSAVFMTFKNDGKSETLLTAAVPTDICKYTELHTHIQEGDIFRMRKVDALEIPANGSLILKPGADHIMLMQLKKPLEEGQFIHVTLVFKNRPKMTIDVPVKSIASSKN